MSIESDGSTPPSPQALVNELLEAWTELSEKQRYILIERHNGRTLEQIGEELGVTRERVRQLQNKAKTKYVSELASYGPKFRNWAQSLQVSSDVYDLSSLASKFGTESAGFVMLSIAFDSLGWKVQKKGSPWFIKDPQHTKKLIRNLSPDEPIRESEWEQNVADSGLPKAFIRHLIEEGELDVERFCGYIIRHKHSRLDRAYVFLLAHGPAQPEQIAAALGETTARNIDAFMARQKVFTKVFPSGNWALSELTEVRYKRAIDAVIDILHEHGPLTRKQLYDFMARIYPVSKSRIHQCLTDYRIGTMPDNKIWLVENGAERKKEDQPAKPPHISVSGNIVGIMKVVDREVLRGSGLMDSRWISWKLGLHATPMRKTFISHDRLPELTVTRAGANTQISTIREAASIRGLAKNCSCVILLDIANLTWDLRHTCTDESKCKAKT